mgnify:CR=1 FL=1|tara:strand:+ start:1784 stop:2368 length:585 start_codon:yes stop_codon:yes gene_type:complete
MGNFCCPSSTSQVVESIHQLQGVETTLSQLIDKYDRQIREERRLARQKMHHKSDCMRHVRIIHMIRLHRGRLEQRLTNCMNKRYQLESLNVTKMHIRAIRTTTKTYRQFLQQHDIDKIEQLQDTLADMIEDACDINESLAKTPEALDIDEDEIEREYDSLCAEIQMPIMPEPPQHTPLIPAAKHQDMELMALTS